ncbi:hypothetical protein GGR55DRAFT_597094 [Xylaria sp. FL0064]|nr:hypothetical protein GGR55DRAFT_597094 [Xylaria sp. FL0064]
MQRAYRRLPLLIFHHLSLGDPVEMSNTSSRAASKRITKLSLTLTPPCKRSETMAEAMSITAQNALGWRLSKGYSR